MNRNHRTNAASLAAFLALVLTATLALPSLAQQSPGPPRKLEIGMPAPPLMIDTWVKGEPIEKLEKGHPYVIEFWATWCGPCRQTIPHLTELQQRYGDKLTIIGISSEPKGLPEVKPFVEKMGAKMDYRVAFDKGGGTNNAWMVAAGRQGIPCSFVVDQKGIIAWIGHPGELGAILDDVVAGTWDFAVYKARQDKIKEVEARLQAAAKAQDAGKMIEGLDELMVVDPARHDQAAVKKFELLLFALHRYDEGYQWATQLVDIMFKDRPEMLNAIAWAIVDGQGLEQRNLDLALRAAVRAEDLTDGANMEVLDTLARVHFEKGNVDKAVTIQEQALKLAIDPKRKLESQARLDKYKAAQG
ncbi:MAG: redoxin domain-containing protein [Candidatus Eisenbacteria bacterium]|nr:redoxin domain-containing protein [Candidatus Eisenbacteria bacterium]